MHVPERAVHVIGRGLHRLPCGQVQRAIQPVRVHQPARAQLHHVHKRPDVIRGIRRLIGLLLDESKTCTAAAAAAADY